MKRKIIYIAGYSRSGSTILDILLGSHTKIFGTGELFYLFEDWLNGTRTCTCGAVYKDCSFWKDLKLPQGLSLQGAREIVQHVENRKYITALTNGKIAPDIIQKYTLIQTALYDYIFTTSGKDIVVDSSKTSRDMAGRFYALHQYTGFDVYVIHLVKNGLSVVESYVEKGRNWALEGYGKNDRFAAARSSVGWFLGNAIAQRLGAKMPANRYIQIKYEDLVAQPESVLQKIGAFVDTDLSEVIAMIQNGLPFRPKHNVGGNRLRLEKEIRFKKSYNSKKIGLSVYHRLIFKIIAGKLYKKLGY
ncbi:sulfotransferase family protein [Ilyomonas limi]|uniref:sulfotransferase family protein n=1 Tax=Ilyomonas limi TaxID=2575867 RepID=UPI001484E845|nr:sulfotransferase [Ilyomonas limi]